MEKIFNNEEIVMEARIAMLMQAAKEAVVELRSLGSDVQANTLEMRLKSVDEYHEETKGFSVLKSS